MIESMLGETDLLREPIRVTEEGRQVGELPAEHVPLDYPDLPWRADPAIGMTADGTIYAAIGMRVFASTDGGTTWTSRPVTCAACEDPLSNIQVYDSFGVLRDGILLWAYAWQGDNAVLCSTDGGKTWAPWSQLEEKAPYAYAGGNQNCMTELSDGTVLWPTRLSPTSYDALAKQYQEAFELQRWQGPPASTTFVYRSTDGGQTWPTKSLLQPWGVETTLLALQSGRLLASIRYQRHRFAPPPANEPPELREIVASATTGDATWPGKRVFFADSHDGGRSWTNFRPLWRQTGGKIDLEHGEAHGHAVQLADGRVLLVYEHRYPYERGDIRARVSHDEGQTWTAAVYHVSQGHGYAGSVVLGDGTIVTVCGNTPLASQGEPTAPWRAQVVRWRLPDDA